MSSILSKLIAKLLVKDQQLKKSQLKIKCSIVFSNEFTYHIYNYKKSCYGVSSEKNSQTDAVRTAGREREESYTQDGSACVASAMLFSILLT